MLSGPNSYIGATAINSGIVNYQNATAFGTNSAITVAFGAMAQVQGGITGGATAMSLSGCGARLAAGAGKRQWNNSYAG